METDSRTLPQDLESCHKMILGLIEDLDTRDSKIRRLQHTLEKLLRWRYGQKSEWVDPNQLVLIASALVEANQDIEEEPKKESKPRAKGHGRKRLPRNLERKRVTYDVPENKRQCPCCQSELHKIDPDISERLEYIPASLVVIEEVSEKYVCPKGCTVVVGEKPSSPIEKGLAGPGLLSNVAVSKYADHLPLHRQEGIFSRQGVDISRSTMCDWMRRCADLVEPIYDLMKDRVLSSKAIQTDDTPVAVLDPDLPRCRKGRIWTYVGDKEHPYTVYDYTTTHSRAGPEEFLKEYKGYIQADAMTGYDGFFKDPDRGLTEVACWAHARRRFFEAQTSDPMRSLVMLAYIRLLYDVEREARTLGLDSAGRLSLRQGKSLPILADIEIYLKQEKFQVLPKSPVGDAIGYALSNWQALIRYCEDGDLEIDNNGAERSLRGVAVGRKNWLFYGSDAGGRTAAILTSLITSCKRHGVDPFAYLRDVFTRIGDHPSSRIEEFLPDKWKAACISASN